jgi:hypothetical protein
MVKGLQDAVEWLALLHVCFRCDPTGEPWLLGELSTSLELCIAQGQRGTRHGFFIAFLQKACSHFRFVSRQRRSAR